MNIREYQETDYEALKSLYERSDLYGGQYDDNRDSRSKLAKRTSIDPNSILVAEVDGVISGTISFIEDGRVAWLFRFAVVKNGYENEVSKALCNKALKILKDKGHNQVLVYAPVNNDDFDTRYGELGFKKGSDYTCYWKDL